MDETSNRQLHYNRFRYYDPETAQYISPDPIGLAGGDRPYCYVHNPISWVDPLGLANYEVNHSKTYGQARNKALAWLEERAFKAERVNTGKFGSTAGKPVGMTTMDGKTGFRIEHDQSNGAHINVFSGKEKGPHYTFEASHSTVTKLQNLFELPSKSWK